MNYYKTINQVNKEIDYKVNQVLNDTIAEIDVNQLVYELTGKYPVSEKAIYKRINLVMKVEKELRLVDDKLFKGGF